MLKTQDGLVSIINFFSCYDLTVTQDSLLLPILFFAATLSFLLLSFILFFSCTNFSSFRFIILNFKLNKIFYLSKSLNMNISFDQRYFLLLRASISFLSFFLKQINLISLNYFTMKLFKTVNKLPVSFFNSRSILTLFLFFSLAAAACSGV